MAPGHCQNKQTLCMCVCHACVSACTHVGERVAAKCRSVSAKTNRRNEKQLPGRGARSESDGGDPARPNTLTPLSLCPGLKEALFPSVLLLQHLLPQSHPSPCSALLPVPISHPIHPRGVRVQVVTRGGRGRHEASDRN